MLEGLNGRPGGLIDIDSTFLPIGQMRQISRVTELDGASIAGEIDLGPGHWVYPQHFPGDPIFPGTLMIEAAGQLVALRAWANGQRGRPRLVRTHAVFRSPVTPAEDRLTVRGEISSKRRLHFATVQVSTPNQEIATISLVLAVVSP
jgi:3-hydroxymyristoyl/3-hydroxydecanoyl-(acyl carrier protein) dehydratase